VFVAVEWTVVTETSETDAVEAGAVCTDETAVVECTGVTDETGVECTDDAATVDATDDETAFEDEATAALPPTVTLAEPEPE